MFFFEIYHQYDDSQISLSAQFGSNRAFLPSGGSRVVWSKKQLKYIVPTQMLQKESIISPINN